MSAADQPSEDGRSNRLLYLAVGGLAIAAAIFAVLYFTGRGASGPEVDEYLGAQAAEVERTAAEIAELLTNYDASSIDNVGDQLLGLTTGDFRSDYEELLPGLGPALERARVSTTGDIVAGPDVSFTESDEALAFVRVEQRIRTTNDPAGREVVITMRLTFVRDDQGSWRADRFEIQGD